MGVYVTRADENRVLQLLDEMAPALGYISENKETHFNGFYLDRLWYSALDGERIPAVGFEIERRAKQ